MREISALDRRHEVSAGERCRPCGARGCFPTLRGASAPGFQIWPSSRAHSESPRRLGLRVRIICAGIKGLLQPVFRRIGKERWATRNGSAASLLPLINFRIEERTGSREIARKTKVEFQNGNQLGEEDPTLSRWGAREKGRAQGSRKG